MDGAEFLDVAIRLSGGGSEGDWRSSVSRAYYGAFHLSQQFVNDCGVELPKTADAHDKLQWCLAQAETASLAVAAEKLASLRAERNTADYDLGASKFSNRQNALLQLKVAQEIVNALSNGRADAQFPEIRTKIQDYATKTLQQPLTADD